MKTNVKFMMIVFFLGIILFYVAPYCARTLSPTSEKYLFIMLLMIINPIYSFISGILFVISNEIKWYLPVTIGMLFAPTVFIFYNSSAIVYSIVYGVVCMIGSLIMIGIQKMIEYHTNRL